MPLQPKNFKSKRRQKGRKLIQFNNGYRLKFGDCGLLIPRPLIFTAIQLSKIKIFLKKATRRGDKTRRKIWFNLFPQLPFSKKPANVRMGKGKGKLKTWFVNIRGGTIFVEYENLRYGRSIYFFKQTNFKLNSLAIFVFRQNLFFNFPMRTGRSFFFKSFWS